MILILPCIDRQKEIQTISGKHESNGARYVNSTGTRKTNPRIFVIAYDSAAISITRSNGLHACRPEMVSRD
jgi:hypothetical protein